MSGQNLRTSKAVNLRFLAGTTLGIFFQLCLSQRTGPTFYWVPVLSFTEDHFYLSLRTSLTFHWGPVLHLTVDKSYLSLRTSSSFHRGPVPPLPRTSPIWHWRLVLHFTKDQSYLSLRTSPTFDCRRVLPAGQPSSTRHLRVYSKCSWSSNYYLEYLSHLGHENGRGLEARGGRIRPVIRITTTTNVYHKV